MSDKTGALENVFSLSNRTIQQDLDTLVVLTTNSRYKEAQAKIANIRKSLDELEDALSKLNRKKA